MAKNLGCNIVKLYHIYYIKLAEFFCHTLTINKMNISDLLGRPIFTEQRSLDSQLDNESHHQLITVFLDSLLVAKPTRMQQLLYVTSTPSGSVVSPGSGASSSTEDSNKHSSNESLMSKYLVDLTVAAPK